MQIINGSSWASLLGQQAGKGIGEGISSGLEALAEHKMHQISKRNTISGIGSLKDGSGKPLFNTEEASSLANLSPQERGQYVKQRLQSAAQQNFENQLYGNEQIVSNRTNPIDLQSQRPPSFPQAGIAQNQFDRNKIENALGGMAGLPENSMNGLIPSGQNTSPGQQNLKEIPRELAPMNRPIPRNLTPQQYHQFVSQREREQGRADAGNKKDVEGIRAAVTNAQDMIRLVDEMDQLIGTGKVATGAKGRLLPRFLQNAETQEYEAKANELAILLAGAQRGVPSAYRIKVAQSTKPNIEQQLIAQKGLAQDIKNKALDVIKRGDILDKIIEENGNFQPPNIATIINRKYNDSKKNENYQENNLGVKPQEQQAIQQQESNESSFSPSNLARVGTGIAARFAEPIGEQLQDIASLGLHAGNYLTGGKVPTYGQLREQYPFLPPQQLSEITDKITQGYTAPHGETEEFMHNVARTAGTLASVFVGGAGKAITKGLSLVANPKLATLVPKLIMPFSGMPWQKALKLGFASEVAGKGLELVGASPGQQSAGKIAALILGSGGFGKGAMLKSAEESYEIAKKNGAGKLVNIRNAQLKLKDLAEKVEKGFDPNKKIVSEVISEAQNALNANKNVTGSIFSHLDEVPIDNLVDLKKQANKWYSLAESPRVPGEKHLPKESKKIIGQITNIINEPIKEFGLKNPDFGKPFALGEDTWRAIHESDPINKFIDKNFSLTLGLKTVLPKALGLGAIATGIGKFAEYQHLFRNHPVAQRHLARALKAATEQNVTAFGREMGVLEKELKKMKD